MLRIKKARGFAFWYVLSNLLCDLGGKGRILEALYMAFSGELLIVNVLIITLK